jgi:hypothetical protein
MALRTRPLEETERLRSKMETKLQLEVHLELAVEMKLMPVGQCKLREAKQQPLPMEVEVALAQEM